MLFGGFGQPDDDRESIAGILTTALGIPFLVVAIALTATPRRPGETRIMRRRR